MNGRTADVSIAGKVFTLSPLTLGGLKRQRDHMVLLTDLKGRGDTLPTAEQLEAMQHVVADSVGLYAEGKDSERTAFFALTDGLDFLEGLTQLGNAVAAMMALSGLDKAKAGEGAGAKLGEAAGS